MMAMRTMMISTLLLVLLVIFTGGGGVHRNDKSGWIGRHM
jgi:hypothetical protein